MIGCLVDGSWYFSTLAVITGNAVAYLERHVPEYYHSNLFIASPCFLI